MHFSLDCIYFSYITVDINLSAPSCKLFPSSYIYPCGPIYPAIHYKSLFACSSKWSSILAGELGEPLSTPGYHLHCFLPPSYYRSTLLPTLLLYIYTASCPLIIHLHCFLPIIHIYICTDSYPLIPVHIHCFPPSNYTVDLHCFLPSY